MIEKQTFYTVMLNIHLYLYSLHCIFFPWNQLCDHILYHTQAESSVPKGNHFLCPDLYLLNTKHNFNLFVTVDSCQLSTLVNYLEIKIIFLSVLIAYVVV